MASGLLGFLGFGKRTKTNLTPTESTPKPEELPFTASLSDLAKSRLRGEGLGYGPDFVDKAANPAIAKLESQFRQQTLPTITSAASARGLGRSSLVTSQIAQAEGNKNQDVADLVSKFYTLNKAQEKNDFTQGLGLAQDLNNQALNIGTQRAVEARNLRDTQLGVDTANNQRANAMQGAVIGAGLNAIAPGAGSVFSSATAPQIGGNSQISQLLSQLQGTQVNNVGQQNLLGQSTDDLFRRLFGSGNGFNPRTMSTPPSGYNLGFNPFGKAAQ